MTPSRSAPDVPAAAAPDPAAPTGDDPAAPTGDGPAAATGPVGASPEPTDVTPPAAGDGPDRERLAVLREERDFLVRSLDDLRREHEAGDVDDADFLALEDDYTARAARVIRAIEAREHPAASASRRGSAGSGTRGGTGRRSRGRLAAIGVGVAAFAVVAGVLVAQAAGRRGEGDTATGSIREASQPQREATQSQMDEAVSLAADGDYEGAIAVYDEVLADQPDNVEALTFKGWFQFLSGDQSGVVTLIDAVEADPDFPAAHAFLAVAFQRLGRPETALAELDRLDELDPPAEIANMVSGLREELEAEVAAGSTTTTAP
jgi:tetratricopeptide (TPR) repeat protein